MTRLPRVTGAELRAAVERDGWFFVRQSGGSHAVFRHSQKPGRVVIPLHAGQILKPKTLTGILKDAGLSGDDLKHLL